MNKKYLQYGIASLSMVSALNGIDKVDAFNDKEFPLNKEIKTSFNNIRTAQDIVNIEDKNLLKAINNQLGRGEVLDNVTIEDMESLTSLDAKWKDIKILDGIEYAVNLKSLNLGSNKISDISKLSGLTKLTTLYIHDNKIENIDALGSLVNLVNLYIGYPSNYGNLIRDISVL